MLPVDAHITFQIIAVVLGAVVLWVLFVNARLPSRTPPAVAKKAEKAAEKPEPTSPALAAPPRDAELEASEPKSDEDEKDG